LSFIASNQLKRLFAHPLGLAELPLKVWAPFLKKGPPDQEKNYLSTKPKQKSPGSIRRAPNVLWVSHCSEDLWWLFWCRWEKPHTKYLFSSFLYFTV